MNGEYLLDAIGLLDDDLIREAETYTVRKQRTDYGKWLGWAASFAVVLVLGYGLTHLRMGSGASGGAATSNGASGAASPSTAPGEPSGSAGLDAISPGAAGVPNGGGKPSGTDGADISMGPGLPEDPCLDPTWPASPSDSSKEGDWCAAIMVDGILYWSTETPIPVEVDESVIQTVTSYTDGQPEKDGQTNFDQSLTTQYAMTDLGLVVLMDHEWVRFDPVPPWER